jgi:hypothetical protein
LLDLLFRWIEHLIIEELRVDECHERRVKKNGIRKISVKNGNFFRRLII